MGPTALLPLRRKWCSGFLSPWSGSNPRTLGPVARTLTTSPPRSPPILSQVISVLHTILLVAFFLVKSVVYSIRVLTVSILKLAWCKMHHNDRPSGIYCSVIDNSILPVIDTNIANSRECIFQRNKSKQLTLFFFRSGSHVSLNDRRNNITDLYFQNNREKKWYGIAT
jgi:hypothetical protein